MDTFYISHGSPTLLIEEELPAAGFLRSWQQKVMVQKPRAILVISGHWDTDVPTVSGVHGINDTIYDFYGFPKSMYQYKYPAPGAPDLAKRVKELLVDGGFTKSVKLDTKRGLDHGAWVPLIKMYPECDIPVCQLSVQTNKDGRYHYNMGKALSSLKNEGVLIMGSGATTHNLRAISHDGRGPATWATDFDTWLKDALLSGRFEDVNDFYRLAPSAKLAHPWPDHFYPLHVAMGAAGDGAGAELVHHSWSHGSLSYASYRFSSSN